jgi:DNA polymerase-3 subunit epsilon
MRAHPSAAKLSLTSGLPRRPGVYLFRDRGGRVLYVGKATNLRSRVRSYFSTDDRRKVPQLLRETVSIDHLVCRGPFEAAVREIRLIQAFQPRFNRQAKVWRKYAYLKLTNERFPRLAVTRVARADGATYLGPLPSAAAAHLVREAIESAVPLRRCTRRLPRHFQPDDTAPCVPAQLGVSTCPCRGQIDDDGYAALVEQVRLGLGSQPALLLEPLETRMRKLAAVERFEEAASTRERLATLSRAITRKRLVEQLRGARSLVIESDEGRLELRYGRLMLPDGPGGDGDGAGALQELGDPQLIEPPDSELPPARDEIDELLVTARHLGNAAGSLHLELAAGTYASVLPIVPSYEMARSRARPPLVAR